MTTAYALSWVWDSDEKAVGYRKSSYVVHDGAQWRCLMCNTGGMHRKLVHTHLRGGHHTTNYARLKKAQQVVLRNDWCMQTVVPNLNKLGLDRWKWHMNHLCYEFINETLPPVTGSSDQALSILATLYMYQAKEKLSLLELAVWKANCLLNHAEVTGAYTVTMQEIEDYWALDERFNPVQYRKELRIKSGISVIVENVFLFLGCEF